MPGYLTNPGTSATSVGIQAISGITSTTVQGALQELLNKNTSVELKAVNSYTDAAARTSALPSPTSGQVTYLTSTKSLEVYNGVEWVAVSSPDEINLVFAQRMFTE